MSFAASLPGAAGARRERSLASQNRLYTVWPLLAAGCTGRQAGAAGRPVVQGRGARARRALCSATYSASVNFAKLSLMAVSCRPRPSAASRLSSGMVYPWRRPRSSALHQQRPL